MARNLYEICDEGFKDRSFSLKNYSILNIIRACFNPYHSLHEFYSISQKLEAIELFLKFVSFEELVESYCAAENREYVLESLPNVILTLSCFLPAAAEYYKNDEHCKKHSLEYNERFKDYSLASTRRITFEKKAEEIIGRHL